MLGSQIDPFLYLFRSLPLGLTTPKVSTSAQCVAPLVVAPIQAVMLGFPPTAVATMCVVAGLTTDMWCEASGLGFVEQCLIVVAGVDKNEWLLGGGWLCGGWTVLDIKGGVSTKD